MIADRLLGAAGQLRDRAVNWHVSRAEQQASYPCDAYAAPGWHRLLRGIDVDAPPAVVFRWVCQLKIAPYSYDLIDNRGRRSPATLTPGAEELAVGQQLFVVEITQFERDHHITGTQTARAQRFFGRLAMSYVVRPRGEDQTRSRLIVCLRVETSTWWRRVIGEPLVYGDLIMMARQLRTLKAYAEAPSSRPEPVEGPETRHRNRTHQRPFDRLRERHRQGQAD